MVKISDRIIGVEEAAQILELDPSRVRVFVDEGRLKSARKIGKGWALLESEVQRLKQDRAEAAHQYAKKRRVVR